MNQSKPRALFISLVISYIISAILLLIISFALYKLKLGEAQINAAIYAVYVISCFMGGIICGKKIKIRRFLWGLLTGALYFVILFFLSWVAGRGDLGELSHFLLVMACCLAGGLVGGMVS